MRGLTLHCAGDKESTLQKKTAEINDNNIILSEILDDESGVDLMWKRISSFLRLLLRKFAFLHLFSKNIYIDISFINHRMIYTFGNYRTLKN